MGIWYWLLTNPRGKEFLLASIAAYPVHNQGSYCSRVINYFKDTFVCYQTAFGDFFGGLDRI